MKIKGFFISIVYLLFFVCLSLHASVAVKDIEYLNGDDFIQLYFKIDKMIPIPDVFYPVKGDNTRIVMRMSDVQFNQGKELFTFDSSVIDSIKINNKSTYVDVEIRLKEQVNYRIFTNPKGLYIEFPKVKNVMALNKKTVPANTPLPQPGKQENTTAKQQTIPQPTPAVPDVLQSPAKPAKTTPTQSKPVFTHTNDDSNDSADNLDNHAIMINDIVLSHKSPDRVTFEVLMSGAPDFNVIPIPDEPVRLAIDFKNTRARMINRDVSFLNVKKVRGAYNSTSTYRVVFDLDYLKNYKVAPRGNIVEISFFNKEAGETEKIMAANQPPTPIPNRPLKQKEKIDKIDKTQPPKTQTTQTTQTIINQTTSSPIVDDNKETINQKNNIDKNDNNHNKTRADIPIVDIQPQPKKEATPLNNTPSTINIQENAPVNVQNNQNVNVENKPVTNDFFGDEKSEVLLQESESQPGTEETVSEDQEGYTTQTIGGGTVRYSGKRMGFNFHDADLKDVIKIISKISGLNIVMDPGISGRVTSQLTDVPWDQALDLFLKINGLAQVREGNILRIGRVEKLKADSEQIRLLQDAQQMEGDLQVVTRTLSYAKVGEITGILKKQLSKRGEILEDARSNTLIISEVPSRIPIIDKLISALDTANPQVSIEARIIETNANYIESFGIQWGYNFIADAAHGNQTTLEFPNNIAIGGNQFTSQSSPLVGPLKGYAVNLPATGATSGTMFSIGNVTNTFRLDMAISAMQSKGKGRIISAPKTTTQNNMEASIMQGKQIPVQTIQNNTVTVQYKPAALELKVTPQITAKGTVICTLEINNNAADFGNLVNGIPPITTQSIKTTVMVDDGGTIVIGGMYRVENSNTKDSVPVLSKIPILGNLFKNSSSRSEQKELLIFITPRIIK